MRTAWLVLVAVLPACGATDDVSGGKEPGSTDAAVTEASLDAPLDEASDTIATPFDATTDDPYCEPPAHPLPIVEAGGCAFDVTSLFVADAGHRLDHVDVRLLGCAGGDRSLPLVSSTAACGTGLGAVFDDMSAPTRLELCPGACALAGECAGGLEIVFGCSGIP